MKRSHDAMKLVCVVSLVAWGCAAQQGGGNSPPPAAVAAPVPPPPAEPPFTNKDVIDLSKAGLGDAVVIAKIKQAPRVAFDLEPKDLQKLKSSKISKGVIAAMLDRSGSGTAAAARPRSFSASGKVWVQNGSQLTEVAKVTGYAEASIGQAFKQAFLLSFSNKTAVIARGTAARLRLTTAPTVIYTRLSPSEIGVVRFTVQESDNRRFVWVVSRVGSNQGEFYPEEDNITFDDEPGMDGVYKLTLKKSMPRVSTGWLDRAEAQGTRSTISGSVGSAHEEEDARYQFPECPPNEPRLVLLRGRRRSKRARRCTLLRTADLSEPTARCRRCAHRATCAQCSGCILGRSSERRRDRCRAQGPRPQLG